MAGRRGLGFRVSTAQFARRKLLPQAGVTCQNQERAAHFENHFEGGLMLRQFMIVFTLLTAGVVPLLSQTASNGDHIISTGDLQKAVRAAALTRQDNLAKIDQFFASEPARKAFETFKLDPVRVSQAVSFLSDEELARLAAQTGKLQHDVAAGALTNQQITYILIALATAVIILVLVR
jgi:hypothetical protein